MATDATTDPAVFFMSLAAGTAAAFLIGSIPFGYLIARSQGIDIRTKGSGNIGATNVWRVMGRRFGLPCFILDVLKGLVPAVIASWLVLHGPARELEPFRQAVLQLSVAVASVFGHMFPPWLKFKGGKGIATSFGALVGTFPVITGTSVIALIVWLVSVRITRMVGISSCLATLAMMLGVALEWSAPSLAPSRAYSANSVHAPGIYTLTIGVLGAIVIFKHRANLARTLAGTEPKIGQKRSTPATAEATRA